VKGTVKIDLNKGKKLDHTGIRVELIGQLENLVDSKQSSTFLQLVRDLDPPGALTDNQTYPFEFKKSEKQFESYNGIMVRIRYYINVTINRQYAKVTKQEEFIV
jgi:vacuolar protein sorting-associated protein 26